MTDSIGRQVDREQGAYVCIRLTTYACLFLCVPASPASVDAAARAEEDALLIGAPAKRDHVPHQPPNPAASAAQKAGPPSNKPTVDAVLAAALRGDDFPPVGTKGKDWIAAKREAERIRRERS